MKPDGDEAKLRLETVDGLFSLDGVHVTGDRNSYGKLYAFYGHLVDGRSFSFLRDGDVSDGDLDRVGTFDVSTYPYNMHFTTPAECDVGACKDFYALSGTYEVTSVSPVYRATFKLGSLHDALGENPGVAIDGEVVGCLSFPNP